MDVQKVRYIGDFKINHYCCGKIFMHIRNRNDFETYSIGTSGAFAASMRTACANGASNKTIKSSRMGAFGFPVHGWEPNTFYTFEYNGRLLTGLPSLASHHSGVAINAMVRVFAEDANELVIQIFHPKYVEVNDVLYPKEEGPAMTYKNDGWNWRNLDLPPFKQVIFRNTKMINKFS